eukprot:1175959-Pyramimonas_sp.AAC.1
MPCLINPENATAWAEYVQKPGEGLPVVTKGKAELVCFNAARKFYPTMGRPELKKKVKSDAAFRDKWNSNKAIVLTAMKQGK